MRPCRQPRVKICCIADEAEAALAVEAGAAAVGLVSWMPSGPGILEEALIARIAARVPPPVASVLLTCETHPSALVAQQRRCGARALQLCDGLTPEERRAVREALPGVALIQVVHVVGPESLEEAEQAALHSDALLLDSGDPRKAVKELGGTGRTHDWSLSRRIREQAQVPVFLAGGLRPENLREAIAEVGPFGVDVCSGVRRSGRLDAGLLEAFFNGCRSAAA